MPTFFSFPANYIPQVTYIGKNETNKFWKHFTRKTNEYILFFIVSGELYLCEEETEYHLSAGEYVLLEAGKEHRGTRPSACEYYYVHFSEFTFRKEEHSSIDWQNSQIQKRLHMNYNESFLSDKFYQDLSILFPKTMSIEDLSLLHSILNQFELAIQYSQTRPIYYKTSLSCCLISNFQCFSNAWMNSSFQEYSMNVNSSMYEKTSKLLTYLHTSYAQKITGEQIEDLFAMSFDYLNRIFKKRTGSTIFSYLKALRVEQAKQLLSTTYLQIGEIAEITGFSDEYYFSRTFKKCTGSTPSFYRKRQM